MYIFFCKQSTTESENLSETTEEHERWGCVTYNVKHGTEVSKMFFNDSPIRLSHYISLCTWRNPLAQHRRIFHIFQLQMLRFPHFPPCVEHAQSICWGFHRSFSFSSFMPGCLADTHSTFKKSRWREFSFLFSDEIRCGKLIFISFVASLTACIITCMHVQMFHMIIYRTIGQLLTGP